MFLKRGSCRKELILSLGKERTGRNSRKVKYSIMCVKGYDESEKEN